MTDDGGHRFRPVPLWAAARRCTRCRLVVAAFDLRGAGFAAYMSGGVLLGDTLDPGFTAPACRTPYAPNTAGGMAPRRRPWAAVHVAAGRTARPTAAQRACLRTGLDGASVVGRAAPATVARVRDLGWLDGDYRVNPAGAAAVTR